MTTQHTPGPWTVYHNGKFVGDETGHVASTDVEGTTSAEAEANARLIAAAPDLLAALREIAETVDHNSKIVIRLRQIAFAAIAKAEGET